MALSKGTLYTSVRLFTERRFGRNAVPQLLGELSKEDQDLVSSIVPVGWYPLEPILRFHRVLDKTFGKGDLALCHEVGRFSAEWQLTSFHKLLLRFKTPEWFFQKGFTLWRQYHDTGHLELIQSSATSLICRLLDFAVVDAAFCKREMGWFERAAELTGGTNVTIEETACRSLGDPYCEYDARWTAKHASSRD